MLSRFMPAHLFHSRFVQASPVWRRAQAIGQTLAWSALLGMVLIALLQHSAARASVQPPFAPDFTVTGSQLGSNFGFAVAAAGDINADGYADLIVGAPIARPGSQQVYIYAGSAAGLSASAFFTASSSQAGDLLGNSVDGGGDVNGDGVDDFIAGAYGADITTDTTDAGIVYVYHGAAGVQPSLALTLSGEGAGHQFGWSAALAGDVNGDGFDDLIAGAWKYDNDRGRVYLFHGSAGGIQPSPALTLTGENTLDGFGYSVDGAGDVNGDSFDDVVIGAWQNDEGGSQAGKLYVYYGSAAGVTPLAPFTSVGAAESELGAAVAGAGDVNGDGYADIVAGAYRDDASDEDAGAVRLYLGSPTGPALPAIAVAAGEAANDRLGFAVNGAGDINGDGFDDLLAGAYLNDAAATNAGKAYAYSGCAGGLLPGALFSATGEYAADSFGRAVAGVGDVNGDGVDDIAVGAYGGKAIAGESALPNGKVFVYHGVKGEGCQAQIALSVTVASEDAAACMGSSELDVPVDSTVAYCYRVQNTGRVALTRHTLANSVGGTSFAEGEITLAPGAVYTYVMTQTMTTAASDLVTWTAEAPIYAPGGAPSRPLGRILAAAASATVTVTVYVPDDGPPTIYLPLITQ
jgi:hypothetical protein